ncbi:MAG: cyclic nucleotide-binding domain-containing protein [Candidatus Neomarinimicrobiota bacterium]
MSMNPTNIDSESIKLKDNSKIAVIGAGPAGTFFSYFCLELARRDGLKIELDIYESKDFSVCGPKGCNHCGGIVSESLVQILSTEGINIPSKVIRRGINSYVMHMDVGSIKIETPLQEKRIAAMYRGAGPRGSQQVDWGSFDGFLQDLSISKGANQINERVTEIDFGAELPVIKTRNGEARQYDLVVGATGLQGKSINLYEQINFGFKAPEATKTFICEFLLGKKKVEEYFGQSMHVFLLNLPRLQFGALIPKGEYVTLVLLGENIDNDLVKAFMNHQNVIERFPEGWDLIKGYPCQCFPQINIKGAVHPYADRLVLVGDCAVSKLYKNGIGAAYMTGKAAAKTVVLHGIGQNDFEQYYYPTCKSLNLDNGIGKFIFGVTHFIQKRNFLKRGVLKMVEMENTKSGNKRLMSTVLWDAFTGSAPYREIFFRTLQPRFWGVFIWKILLSLIPFTKSKIGRDYLVSSDDLGQLYRDGEKIITQGEKGDSFYVIQSGKVEVVQEKDGREIKVAELGEQEFFGEMAIFEKDLRSSTVRALGETRILTVDYKTLLRTINSDPTLAFRLIQKMSARIRNMDNLVSRVMVNERRNWLDRPERNGGK